MARKRKPPIWRLPASPREWLRADTTFPKRLSVAGLIVAFVIFVDLYSTLVDRWEWYDNSGITPRLISEGDNP